MGPRHLTLAAVAAGLAVAFAAAPALAQYTQCKINPYNHTVDCYAPPPPPGIAPVQLGNADASRAAFMESLDRMHQEEMDDIRANAQAAVRRRIAAMITAGQCEAARNAAVVEGDIPLANLVVATCRPSAPVPVPAPAPARAGKKPLTWDDLGDEIKPPKDPQCRKTWDRAIAAGDMVLLQKVIDVCT